MGGLTGPGRSLYPTLGSALAAEGRAAMAVQYRKPGDLSRCLLDVCAAADLALRNGAQRFVILGHSFGGAVAIQAAGTFPAATAGVITYATQSAGCEEAGRMGAVPLLLLHGERDSILGPENSMMVQALAGHGDVRTFPDTDHLLSRGRRRDRGTSPSTGSGVDSMNTPPAEFDSRRELGVDQFLHPGLDSPKSSRRITQGPRRAIASSRVRAWDPAGAWPRNDGSVRFRGHGRGSSRKRSEHMFACRDRNHRIGCATMTP